MTKFERILQDCLQDLEQDAFTVDECLRRHPMYAAQLEPVLQASVNLARGREARVSGAFKARVRTKLLQDISARPRRQARSGFLFMRLATTLAVMVLVLLTAGTVYAQQALPGEAFYAWKLVSENVWRTVSPDPVATDIVIAERRVNELIAVNHDPALYTDVLKAYIEVTDRLKQEMDAETEALILAMLETQIEELNQSGILLPQPPLEIVPPLVKPTSTSTPTSTPLPLLQTPQANSTDLPQVVPTIQVPTEIVPPVQEPPNIIPTVGIPLIP